MGKEGEVLGSKDGEGVGNRVGIKERGGYSSYTVYIGREDFDIKKLKQNRGDRCTEECMVNKRSGAHEGAEWEFVCDIICGKGIG